MIAPMIDFRSDTVTRPTNAMREAMMAAPLGDDVLGDEPTVQALEAKVAALLGKEAALFVPSGTMANQLAIRSVCEAGDEIIAHRESHIIHYETGAPAALAGCMIAGLDGAGGLFEAKQVRDAIRPRDQHAPMSRMLILENTHNRGGGTVWPLALWAEVAASGSDCGLHVHIDGARLMNACVAIGCAPMAYTQHADSVCRCAFQKRSAHQWERACGERSGHCARATIPQDVWRRDASVGVTCSRCDSCVGSSCGASR